jgi:hypothetical protein
VWPIREAYPSLTTLMLKGGGRVGCGQLQII